MFRLLITSTLLLASIGFLGYSLHDGLRSDGIATITIDIPFANFRHKRSDLEDLGSNIISKVSEAAGQATDIDIATRVSELTAQATALLDPLLNEKSLKVTLGTDRLCYIQHDDTKRCRDLPSRVSDLLPAPFNKVLDVDVPILTTILTINVRICLIFALIGALALVVAFVTPFYIGLPLLQVIPGMRLACEVAIFLLAILPLLIATVVAFSIFFILRKIDALNVSNGNLIWCLGVALAVMSLSGILFFRYRCR